MYPQLTNNTLEHQFDFVKSPITGDTPQSPDSMIHHNSPSYRKRIIVSYKDIDQGKSYGVSSAFRVLSPQLLFKKFDYIRDCLKDVLDMTTAEREVTLRLLRYWAYYGNVYPKEATITEAPGCSKATFWRTCRKLEALGLLRVINRFVIRPHAQISNLYRLDRLVLLLARYLAEHGTGFYERWLRPYLAMPGGEFWSRILRVPGDRAGPVIPAF